MIFSISCSYSVEKRPKQFGIKTAGGGCNENFFIGIKNKLGTPFICYGCFKTTTREYKISRIKCEKLELD